MGPQRIPRGRAGGRCVRKWRFSKKETAFAGGTFFSGALKKMPIFKNENALRPVENQGDDATENVNFQRRKQRLQDAKISS